MPNRANIFKKKQEVTTKTLGENSRSSVRKSCILEHYRAGDGTRFTVPKALRKYVPGQPEFLPFIKELSAQLDKSKDPLLPR